MLMLLLGKRPHHTKNRYYIVIFTIGGAIWSTSGSWGKEGGGGTFQKDQLKSTPTFGSWGKD